MGGSFSYKVYRTEDRAQVKKLWETDVAESLHQDGRSYSGEIGMLGERIARWHPEPRSIDDATDYLENHHDKWEPAEAVCVFLPENGVSKAGDAELQAQKDADKACLKALEIEKAVREEVKALAREFATCPTCKSKLARVKLAGYHCPLCKDTRDVALGFLGNARQLARIKAGRERYEQADKARQEAGKARKQTSSKSLGWLVGGWCSS